MAPTGPALSSGWLCRVKCRHGRAAEMPGTGSRPGPRLCMGAVFTRRSLVSGCDDDSTVGQGLEGKAGGTVEAKDRVSWGDWKGDL